MPGHVPRYALAHDLPCPCICIGQRHSGGLGAEALLFIESEPMIHSKVLSLAPNVMPIAISFHSDIMEALIVVAESQNCWVQSSELGIWAACHAEKLALS